MTIIHSKSVEWTNFWLRGSEVSNYQIWAFKKLNDLVKTTQSDKIVAIVNSHVDFNGKPGNYHELQ